MMRTRGFTLIETMITLSVLAILLSVALPAMRGMILRAQLSSAAETLYSDLQFARLEAIKQQRHVLVSFTPGKDWCYGMTLQETAGSTACDCRITTAGQAGFCSLKRVEGKPFAGITLSESFAGGQTGFGSLRGTAWRSGTATFASDKAQARITLSRLGLLRLCTPAAQNGSFPPC